MIFWMAARFIYALAPTVARTGMPDILIAFFYFFLLAAADSRPHVESDDRRVSLSGELARYGGSFIIVGLLVYFVLLPAHYASPESRTWLPSLSFVVAMDFILLLRFGFLWKSCQLFRWRAVYGLIFVTVTLWIITDTLELLNQAEGWTWEWRGISGIVWLLPFFPLMLSARVRHFPFPVEDLPPSGYPGLAPVETLVRSRNYLVVYAVAFPVVHFGLYALHVLDPVLRDAREMVVLSSVLALGGLALVDRFLLEKESHTILAETGKAEEALRSSEERYRALVENSQGLICTHDMEGKLLSVNPASAHLLGYEPEDMVGHNASEFLTPWSLSREEKYYGYLERDRENTGLLKVKTRDGAEQVWVYRSTLVEEPGKEPYVLGHAQDITDRIKAEDALRRSEDKFRTLMEDAPNAIVITSLDGRIVEINRAVGKMFGYSKDELLGKGVEVLAPERFRETYARRRQEFASHPKSRPMGTGLEFYARRKDGSEFPVEVGLGVFETEEGLLVGATVLDITERKEVEKMKDELVSMVSHELRTPLTSIRGALGLVSAGLLGNLTEKARHMLEVATNNTDRLVRLLNDILDIHRMEAGRIELVKLECDARELMQSVEEAMHPVAEKAGVSMEIMSVSKPFLADPDRIIQVLTNLMGNAIKFSPPGSRVWLTADCQDGDLLFHVKDEGRGIPLHQQEAIFDRFQQVDASDAREKGGVGLGLAICKKIVEQHGGRIWVESEPDQGSTFSFSLPLKTEQS